MRKEPLTKRLLLTAATALAAVSLQAQQLAVGGTVTGSLPHDMTLMLMPTGSASQRSDTLKVSSGRLSAAVERSPWGIYRVIGVTPQQQIILPVAITSHDGSAELNLVWNDGQLAAAGGGDDNTALAYFNARYSEHAKRLWTEGKNMDAATLGRFVRAYLTIADSAVAGRAVTPAVAGYIRLWAAAVTHDAVSALEFSAGRKPSEAGLSGKDFADSLCAVIDCDMSEAFPQTAAMALASLPQGSLEMRMEALRSRYRNEGLRSRATDMMMAKYISSFPYSTRYDEGLAELTAVTDRYALSRKYLDDFTVRRASAAGNPFPDGVELCDISGRKIDFADFRGKYVYIDLWASWCVPCIKEIPHLKKLEEELQNKDVVFLSVSIDRSEEAWKKKVSELGLKGNLLIDREGRLANAMNVKGIPFFLIYDRQGRLYKYNAYRPSDARLKPLLESLK